MDVPQRVLADSHDAHCCARKLEQGTDWEDSVVVEHVPVHASVHEGAKARQRAEIIQSVKCVQMWEQVRERVEPFAVKQNFSSCMARARVCERDSRYGVGVGALECKSRRLRQRCGSAKALSRRGCAVCLGCRRQALAMRIEEFQVHDSVHRGLWKRCDGCENGDDACGGFSMTDGALRRLKRWRRLRWIDAFQNRQRRPKLNGIT
mmetsp:Transcript_6485/g.21303  ORF Transcript_6485/g.21303 Transcript_6485/m.21303 type:complete len:206 (+) Transcript_6485:1699-2316(+)